MKSVAKFILQIGIVVAIVSVIFLSHMIFFPTEGCDKFLIAFDCDLSGWMSLILGDMMISITLALFWKFIASRHDKKIEENGKAIQNNKISIQKILTEQYEIRQRRQIYVIQSFKNHFSTILLFLGVVHHSKNIDQDIFENTPIERKEFESLLYKCRNTLNLSIDVIDPMLVEQIDVFLILIEQKILQNKKPLNYNDLKNTIMKLTTRLDEYYEESKVLK